MDRSQLRVAQGFGYLITELPNLYRVPKAKYYNRKGEEMVLPADPYSMKHYLQKGYSLEPPKLDKTSGFVCDICGKEVKTALALAGHKRSHK